MDSVEAQTLCANTDNRQAGSAEAPDWELLEEDGLHQRFVRCALQHSGAIPWRHSVLSPVCHATQPQHAGRKTLELTTSWLTGPALAPALAPVFFSTSLFCLPGPMRGTTSAAEQFEFFISPDRQSVSCPLFNFTELAVAIDIRRPNPSIVQPPVHHQPILGS